MPLDYEGFARRRSGGDPKRASSDVPRHLPGTYSIQILERNEIGFNSNEAALIGDGNLVRRTGKRSS